MEGENDRTLQATLYQKDHGNLDHLVCDFNDLDVEQTIRDY